MQIDRCVCYQKRFSELKEVAAATESVSVESLQLQVTFGAKCKMCHPYVKRMLATGETVFYQILTSGD